MEFSDSKENDSCTADLQRQFDNLTEDSGVQLIYSDLSRNIEPANTLSPTLQDKSLKDKQDNPMHNLHLP